MQCELRELVLTTHIPYEILLLMENKNQPISSTIPSSTETHPSETSYQRKKRHDTKITVIILIVFIVGPFFLIIFGPFLAGLIAFNYVYSEGDRTGQIVKLSNRGIIWKTLEGTLMLTQTGGYGPSWNFSIDNQDPQKEQLLSDLVNARETGDVIKVHYEERIGTLPWRASTSYLVKDVEFLGGYFHRYRQPAQNQ
ncbi:MAG: hypothetical protein AAB583_06865 [Patescibacteria group bacterium]